MNASAAHRKRKRERWEYMRSYVCIYMYSAEGLSRSSSAAKEIDRPPPAGNVLLPRGLSVSFYISWG